MAAAPAVPRPDTRHPTPDPSAPAAPGAQADQRPGRNLVKFMNESRSIPTATSFRTLEVATLDTQRKALKAAGKKLSFTHLIAWAIVQAWRDMPVMGHSYQEVDGQAEPRRPRARSRSASRSTCSARTARARWSYRC
jgi:2-oxoglutarate dehydrogenase E1 component